MQFDDEDLSPYEKRLIRGARRRNSVGDLYDSLSKGGTLGCWILFIAFDIAVTLTIYYLVISHWTT